MQRGWAGYLVNGLGGGFEAPGGNAGAVDRPRSPGAGKGDAVQQLHREHQPGVVPGRQPGVEQEAQDEDAQHDVQHGVHPKGAQQPASACKHRDL